MNNRRGGKRPNSGRKNKNKTWSKPGDAIGQRELTSFFASDSNKPPEIAASIIEEGKSSNNESEPSMVATGQNDVFSELPNYDADNYATDLEELRKRTGKRVEGSRNLIHQKKSIITTQFFK